MSIIVPTKPISLNVSHKVRLTPETPVLVKSHARKRPTRSEPVANDHLAQLQADLDSARDNYRNAGAINGYAFLKLVAARIALDTYIGVTNPLSYYHTHAI